MSLLELKLKCKKAIESGGFLNPRETLDLLTNLEGSVTDVEALKLPIKVVVNSFIQEPMLMLGPHHMARLMDIASRMPSGVDIFRNMLSGTACPKVESCSTKPLFGSSAEESLCLGNYKSCPVFQVGKGV